MKTAQKHSIASAQHSVASILRQSLAVAMIAVCGPAFSHGTENHSLDHKNYDSFLAAIVREEEQSNKAVLTRYVTETLADLPANPLLSELIDAVLGKKASAVVGGNPASYGQWGSVITWPFAFASAANLPDGRILAWGGNKLRSFNGGIFTYASIWNPANGQFVSVNHTSHSLFCGMPVMLEDGRVFVSGGDNGSASSVRGTSTFNFSSQSWTRIQDLAVGRWYNGSIALPNGKVFSALGEPGSVYPELWTQGLGWSYLNGINLQSGVLDYPTVTEPNNWLPHMHLAPNGKIFHSGHTPQMHYIDTTGNGTITPVGLSNSWNTANTPSILYDEGKILQSGGALYSTANPVSGKSKLIDINAGQPSQTVVSDMIFPRIFHNEVVLPNGEVMAIGGNSGKKFSDDGSQMTPEMWNPVSRSWRALADMSIPRNYHSVALLMTDGRVWSGGGGLCDCPADHLDSQVYSPPYLFNVDGSLAERPEILNAPDIISYGVTANVTASTNIRKFTLIRMSATTHAFNSDMRFLNVPFISNAPGQYTLTFHGNRDVMVPGYWMLFALNEQGVPSVAKVLKVSTTNSPVITNPGDQITIQNSNVNLVLKAADPNGDPLIFNVTGLPQGLNFDANTGVISGVPTLIESSRVILSATDGISTATTNFVWNVVSDQTPVASTISGGSGGTSFGDSAQANEKLIGVNIRHGGWLDGIQGVLNTGNLPLRGGNGGSLTNITWPDNEYLVRIFGTHGSNIGKISFVTNTGRSFGPFGLAQGANNVSSFDISAPVGREIIGFTGRSGAYLNAIGIIHRTHVEPNTPPFISAIANQVNTVGDAVNLPVTASDPESHVITYHAFGLPDSLNINAASGIISGTTDISGVYDVTVEVKDSKGAISTITFKWTIEAQSLSINPLSTSPKPTNTPVTLTANVSNAINPRYKWSFGDGTAETAYSPQPSTEHSFASPGLHVVRLTVIDDRNIESTNTFIQAIHLPHTANRPNQSSNMGISSLSGVNLLWVVNQDNDSVSVFNADNETKMTEVAVGKSPRSIAIAPSGKAWVTNKKDATISIIDPITLQVQQTLSLSFASQPFGLAFAPDGGAAYVVLEAAGKVLKLNPLDGAIIASIDVGLSPRHIAIQSDSTKLYVSRFISRPLPGENSATVQTSDNQGQRGGEVLVINAATMVLEKTIVLQHSDKEDTENKGAGVPNYLSAAALSPDGKTAWIPSKQDNVKRGTLRNAKNLNFQNTVRAIASKINLASQAENYGARIDFDNSGIAATSIYDRSGAYLFVALETSREVVVVDAYGGRELRRIPVGLAPDGLALAPNGLKLFVNNFMDRNVSFIDLTDLLSRGDWLAPVTNTLASVGVEKLSAQVLKGKQLFYDAKDLRLASDAYLSCASCHNDGGHDGRIWDLTGFGEGLRNTIDLRGRGGLSQGLLHWSANFDEVQDFEGQIRAMAGGTGLMSETDFAATQNPIGASKAGLSSDLDALAAYVSSLTQFDNSPFRNGDGTLSQAAQNGKSVFISSGCIQCHEGSHFTDSPSRLLHNIGTVKQESGQRLGVALTGIDTPTLRDAWNTAPYLHDGSARTLQEAIRAHNNVALTDGQIEQVANYVREIGGSEPALAAANTAPSVALTAPANGTILVSASAITLTANAVDSDGFVAKVDFFVGTTLIGSDTTAPYSVNWQNLATGNYVLTAKAYDNLGLVSTSNSVNVVVQPAEISGLSGKYFNNVTLSGTPALTRDEAVNFNWGTASPGAGVNPNNFSARWTGQVTAPTTGNYRFATTSDDGVRLYINGVRRINNWTDHAVTTNRTSLINLVGGVKYNIVMEYYERTGSAVARLSWLQPGATSYSAIPTISLTNTENPTIKTLNRRVRKGVRKK